MYVSGQQSKKKPYYRNSRFINTGEWNTTNDWRTKSNIMIQSALRVSYTSPKVMHWITQLLIWLSAESCKHTCDEDMTKYDAVAEAIAQKAVKENFFDVCKDGAFAMGVNTPHIVFNYLDFLIWNGNRKKYDNFDFEFRNSVEHWYPQNPSEGTFAQWKDGVDQFGNLCIIQRNVNSKFSNMSPEAKKSTFRDMISKGSLKLRIMSELTEKRGEKPASLYWRETAYKQHEEEMLSMLMKACGIESLILFPDSEVIVPIEADESSNAKNGTNLNVASIMLEWAKSRELLNELVVHEDKCGKRYVRFTTALTSSVLPEAQEAASGWKTRTHYFYEIVNEQGKKIYMQMVINPEQAKTVRMIFDMYLDGMGLKSIKYELESRGRLTAMGKTQWFESVISKVLRNSFYCGIMTYHKYYCPDYLKQNRVKNMGEIEMTYTKGTHEPIVTEEEFNLVQARMDARTRQLNNCPKGKRVAPKREPATIWGKLMKCSCGCKFNQRGWNHHNGADEMAFQCYSKLAHGSVTERKKRGLPTKDTCTTPIIPKWKMELIAHEIFTKHFTDISAVTELACKMIEEHINDVEDVEDNTEIIAQKNAEIEKLERKKVGLIEMRADGDIERDYFLMRKDEVEKQIECLRQEIQELTPIDTRQKKENLVERLEALKQKLSEYTDFENTLIIPDGVIEAFTEQIIASDKGFDWYLKAVPDMVKSFMDDTPDDETEKEWHELTQFDLTIEDAKAYVYSFSSRRRVHGWQNIKIRLFV